MQDAKIGVAFDEAGCLALMDVSLPTPLDAFRRMWAEPVQRFAAKRKEDLGHLAWYLAFVEAYREANLQHIGSRTYLDYAGAALYGAAQIQAASAALLENFFANPHTSVATEEIIGKVRNQMLHLFGTSAERHTLIFTGGATHALQLLGENFAWSAHGVFVYAQENHTSVVGLRQYARRSDVACGTVTMQDVPLLFNSLDAAKPLAEIGDGCLALPHRSNSNNLLALPGESNFSGARLDLNCIAALRTGPLRWRVLLDAAKLACMPGALDLGSCDADFTVISFYKMFGYPTGLGALLVRQDAASLLAPQGTLGDSGPLNVTGPAYFGGGCVSSISATSGFAVPRPALTDWLERGTAHFLGIVALPSQLAAVRQLGCDEARRRHALAVCREAYLRMEKLKHESGVPLCRIFGRHAEELWDEVQGPTIACILRFPDGSIVPYELVQERAAARDILLRTGCHCNAGACQQYLELTDADLRHFFASGKVCGDSQGVIDGRPTGVIRISFGLFSTLADVTRWISLLEDEFLNAAPAAHESIPICAAPAARPKDLSTSPVPPLPALKSVTVGREGGGKIVGLKVFPIKGCGPLDVKRWPIDPSTGAFLLDRRWCLTLCKSRSAASSRLQPVSAKQAPKLTQIKLALARVRCRHRQGGQLVLVLRAKQKPQPLVLPLPQNDAEALQSAGAEVDSGERASDMVDEIHDYCPDNVSLASKAAHWFEDLLGISTLRLVEAGSSPGTGEAPSSTHFANAPSTFLMVSTASLKEFSRLTGLAAPANRFRANIEVEFEVPFAEDKWENGAGINIARLEFEAAGRCVRCQAVDVDPDSGAAEGPSLLAALATAQQAGGKGPTFGVLLRLRSACPEEGSVERCSQKMFVLERDSELSLARPCS